MYVPGNEHYFTLGPAGVLGHYDEGQNIFRRSRLPTGLGWTYHGRDLPGVFAIQTPPPERMRTRQATRGHARLGSPSVRRIR